MKQSLQLKIGQQLAMTPQLQQAIRLLQLSTLELQTEIQEAETAAESAGAEEAASPIIKLVNLIISEALLQLCPRIPGRRPSCGLL